MQDCKIAKMVNVQGREVATRVARVIYARGSLFNMVQSPYWQVIMSSTNTIPQGFKGPKYEKIQTNLLKKENEFVEDVLAPIHSSWISSRISIVSNGWTNTRHRPLININVAPPKRAMFLKDYSSEKRMLLSLLIF